MGTLLAKIKLADEPDLDPKKGKGIEWDPSKRWNPFNSYKLLAHVDRWKKIKRGKPIPPPILITVDPTNVCNFNCIWCNAEFIRKERKGSLSKKMLLNLADFLPRWGEGSPDWAPGVGAVCIAGGGEPLLNPATPVFIDKVAEAGIEVGIVTNGSMINRYIDSLSHCTWVGVSVDAARSETFNKFKGAHLNNTFDHIIENIATLADYAKRHNNRLGLKHPAYGVSYKYLLYKDNIGEIYQAAKLAKEIGCKNIHLRPAGTTWDKLGTEQEIIFSSEDIALFNEQIAKALELDGGTFGVYGVTHKFNSQFDKANYFDKCYAIFMTAVIGPPARNNASQDSFVLGLCCDRRGDEKLELASDVEDVEEIQKFWGNGIHWKIHDRITVEKECPRCTYQPHNQIYEQVILNDSMTYKFI
ncbi:MAG: radical SAM protein [Desulfobacterales bacterium]|nr:radical SAM protein [Desulfobacterales bacterium]